ncbi:RNA polymerase sigma factor [Paludisphaera mucosa]|uniref:Sigma-70 family RNA polymerase sigma factor n=1 Tax=Paludisphaera mucosa TaxID=3030827 RepID=A0ABT6FLD6_9BACT|nr:sigma-70 family RNA polymerase sigma factor [Paludisphaera mucosa]MDG3008391.1 sigma-70 family RNA polymerase sigma factor [Paludisphaera mucosa]
MTEPSIAGRADGPTTDDGSEPSDDVLLARTSDKSDESSCRAAWGMFYGRHAEYLYGVCMPAYRTKLGETGVGDLVAETFLKVYDKAAATYQPARDGDADYRRQRVRAWLGTIAKNLVRDILRGRKRLPASHLEHDEWRDVPEHDQSPQSTSTEEVSRAMEQVLSEREQDVLRVTFHWHDPTKDRQKLPNEAVDELARLWNLKPDNIRQIRRRALQKLKAALPPDVSADASGR